MHAIDPIVDRLDAALRGAGLEGLEPAGDSAALDELDHAISPYTLPADLRRFWERIAFSSLRASTWSMPEPEDPARAIETHNMNQHAEFRLLYGPPLLFPIARISGDQWSIELASSWSDGGVVFEHADVEIRMTYPTFSDMLEVYAELLEEGRFVRWKNGYASMNRDDEAERQDARFSAAWPHPLYGAAREVSREPDGWPAHWLASAGIDLRDREPLGVTHTIAELARAAEEGPLSARIAGRVVRVFGVGGDALVLVEDETRTLHVLWPAGTSPWAPSTSGRYEFEVHVTGPLPAPVDLDRGHAELQEHAPAGRDAAQAAAERFLGRIERDEAAAVATAVRPLD